MPKMKTNSGAKKRFKAKKGGIKRRSANRNHILTKKAKKRKRQLGTMPYVDKSNVAEVKRLLNIS